MNEHFTLDNESCQFDIRGCRRNSAHKLPVTNWLCDVPTNSEETDLVEVQFKNTRKGYYHNSEHLLLEKGTMVAVEANPGHDIGEVSLTGKLVLHQMRKYHIDTTRYEIRKIYRIATEHDLQRAQDAHEREQETMILSRQLAKSLGLEMKIGDVEYQGDGSKAIFYYIADGRVDFRQLIKVYAETFRIRIEMKQIGARQEAGRIGGTGPCGRELCCSTWMTQFTSVGTSAARLQNISPNPQKLAGQCAKLKCCLNYEVPIYEDAAKQLPPKNIAIETKEATYYYFSADTLKGEITYSTEQNVPVNLTNISKTKAWEFIELNRRGEKPQSLNAQNSCGNDAEPDYQNVVGQDDLTRFDKKKNRHRDRHHRDKKNSQKDESKQTNPHD